MTIPKAPDEDPVIPDMSAVRTVKLTSGPPGIFKIAPELIHRVAEIGSNILTVPPHGGAMITFLSIAGLNHKNGFKEGFIIVTGSAIVAQIIMVVVGGLML